LILLITVDCWELTSPICHLNDNERVECCHVVVGCRNTSDVRNNFDKFWGSKSLGLWILPIVRNSKQLENSAFRKLDLFLSLGEERQQLSSDPVEKLTSIKFPNLSKGSYKIGFSLSSPEDGKRFSFRNVLFPWLFTIPTNVQNPRTHWFWALYTIVRTL
jgi:hypothetical protein